MTVHRVLFGTYTRQSSKGIYEANFDSATGQLADPKVVFEGTSPTYLAISAANNVYAVEKRGDQGGVVALDNATRPMDEIGVYLTEGSSPAYIAIDEDRHFVFAGYYHRGTVEIYSMHEDGALTLKDTWHNSGSGPRPEQDSSHVHYVNLTPDNRLVVVDLGTDEVITLDIDDEGLLTDVARYKAEDGFGPRHLRFSPDGQYAYVLGELSSLLSVLKYSAEDGTFAHVMTISTIPTDWDEHNGAAAIRLSSDGRFIYTSNRGHDSVSVYQTSNLGAEIELIQTISTEGSFPRDMNFDPEEKFLVVANQKTDNVSVFSRDTETGELTLVQKDFPIPEGVRVKFEG
ncbi:3-carboxymuconate cyclase [Fructobacillus pseudoficulneus]|uniref:3-carboxymuconate cyclase n=1 Tax=Fructobacillus pseudoficulneus TaxID=220714 RepID=A0A3F3H0S8_9LACO|nr:lactonase family protein [Fructobacillus pseudoficulneus]GAP02268.1 3-carboxymuconate cyclase [Fructobacillus pseudoficulneus]SEH36239.1 6-phosphogluconolactonase [Fructobacillus pseudoficulneus]